MACSFKNKKKKSRWHLPVPIATKIWKISKIKVIPAAQKSENPFVQYTDTIFSKKYNH